EYGTVRSLIDKFNDFNLSFEFAHRVALISDSAKEDCIGNYVYNDSRSSLCANSLQHVDEIGAELASNSFINSLLKISSSLFKRHLQMQRVFNRVEWSRLKVVAAKTVVFHLITSMWGTPSESYFLWMRGFCPSDLMKMLAIQLHLLTEQQVVGIYSLQHSSQQAEEALSQGLDQLHHLLVDTIAS
ncbi:transcription factor TGA9 isoform X1, partial [Tanacetum coccineum]